MTWLWLSSTCVPYELHQQDLSMATPQFESQSRQDEEAGLSLFWCQRARLSVQLVIWGVGDDLLTQRTHKWSPERMMMSSTTLFLMSSKSQAYCLTASAVPWNHSLSVGVCVAASTSTKPSPPNRTPEPTLYVLHSDAPVLGERAWGRPLIRDCTPAHRLGLLLDTVRSGGVGKAARTGQDACSGRWS